MESIINSFTSNPILLAIAILLASLLIYSILKRLVKLIIILIIALSLYLGYMNYTGKKIDPALQNYLNQGGKEIKEIQRKKEKLSDTIDTVNKLTDSGSRRTSPEKK